MKGLTAEEAREAAGLSPRSCYWKRCSELRECGFIRPTGETRPGDTDMHQMVCVITDTGEAAVAEMERTGFFTLPRALHSARNNDPQTSHDAAADKRRRARATSHAARLLVEYNRVGR